MAPVSAISHCIRFGFNPEKNGKKYWIAQLGMQWIVNLSEKTLYHLRKQYKGNNAQIFLYLLFLDVF